MTLKINFANLTFNKWVKLVFSHPVAEPAWYWDEELWQFREHWADSFDPKQYLLYATQLFKQPAFLLKKYSIEQIEQGFWLLLSGPSGFNLGELVWNKKLPWRVRQACVLSMGDLFQNLFTKTPDLIICFMWWDELRDWDFRKNRDPKIRDIVFQTLSLILAIPSEPCQMSALHGLGHLKHSETKTLITDYLKQNPRLKNEIKKYAHLARKGKVL